MSVNFWSTNTQLKTALNHAHGALYQYMHEHAHNPNARNQGFEWIRLGAPFIGLASGVLTVATRVALIAESVFKGIGHLSGALFKARNASLGKGLTLLILEPLKHTMVLPFSCLCAIYDLARGTLCLLGCETYNYSYTRWIAFDPIERAELEALRESTLENYRQAARLKQEALQAVQAKQQRLAEAEAAATLKRQNKQEVLQLKNSVDARLESSTPLSRGEKSSLYRQCCKLIVWYYTGEKIAPNAQECARYARVAADLYQNTPYAPYVLCSLGIADIVSGQEWVSQLRAAEQALETMEDKMSAEAFPHYLTLAKYGNPGAKWMIGVMFWVGVGCPGRKQNLPLALAWMKSLGRPVPHRDAFQREWIERLSAQARGACDRITIRLLEQDATFDKDQHTFFIDDNGPFPLPFMMTQVMHAEALAHCYEEGIDNPHLRVYPDVMNSGFEDVRGFFRPGDYNFADYPILLFCGKHETVAEHNMSRSEALH